VSEALRPSFESIYMGLAQALSKRSTCSRLQVGCVIVSSDWRKVFGVGYNGGAAGQGNACESLEPGKCGHLHAEENALINADTPHGAEKFVLCTSMPCPMCCKRIVNSRNVSRVYFVDGYRDPAGIDTLRRARIELFQLDANGQYRSDVWRPLTEEPRLTGPFAIHAAVAHSIPLFYADLTERRWSESKLIPAMQALACGAETGHYAVFSLPPEDRRCAACNDAVLIKQQVVERERERMGVR